MSFSIDVRKWPVVILATPRSGSTALAKLIAAQHGVPYYLEPHSHLPGHVSWEQVHTESESLQRRYVLKHMYPWLSSPEEQCMADDYNNAHVIRLYRRDKVAQICSKLVVATTKMWHWRDHDDLNLNYSVQIDDDTPCQIEYFCHDTLTRDFAMQAASMQFDNTFAYEDLDFSGQDLRKTPIPQNIDEVSYLVREKLHKFGYPEFVYI